MLRADFKFVVVSRCQGSHVLPVVRLRGLGSMTTADVMIVGSQTVLSMIS